MLSHAPPSCLVMPLPSPACLLPPPYSFGIMMYEVLTRTLIMKTIAGKDVIAFTRYVWGGKGGRVVIAFTCRGGARSCVRACGCTCVRLSGLVCLWECLCLRVHVRGGGAPSIPPATSLLLLLLPPCCYCCCLIIPAAAAAAPPAAAPAPAAASLLLPPPLLLQAPGGRRAPAPPRAHQPAPLVPHPVVLGAGPPGAPRHERRGAAADRDTRDAGGGAGGGAGGEGGRGLLLLTVGPDPDPGVGHAALLLTVGLVPGPHSRSGSRDRPGGVAAHSRFGSRGTPRSERAHA